MEQIVKVQPKSDYKLELWFKTGEHKLFDCTPYLNKGIFTALKDQAFFNKAHVKYGTVCWPNNMDLSPETLFDKSILAGSS